MADSFALNGTDLSGTAYGLTIGNDFQDQWLPAAGVAEQVIPFGFGGYAQQVAYQPRRMTIPCVISGTSSAQVHGRLDALARLIYQRRNVESSLKFDHISDRYWMVRYAGAGPTEFGMVEAQQSLEFIAPDPRAYSTTLVSAAASIVADPHDYTHATGGSAPTEPIIQIRNTTGGNVTAVTVSNTATGKSLTWTGSLQDGRWLKFDCGRRVQQVLKSTTSGTDPEALAFEGSMLGVLGDFPVLEPGISNTIRVEGIGTGNFKIAFRERYL